MNGMKSLVLLGAILAAACASEMNLKQALQVADVSSGWFDAGIVDGKNKLVPSVTFRLKQVSGDPIRTLSLNIVFKKVGDPDEEHHDDVFVQRVDFQGAETQPITVRSEAGYTADPPQTRLEMLKHSQFRDMEARIFAKQSSGQWIELHRVTLARQLLTQ